MLSPKPRKGTYREDSVVWSASSLSGFDNSNNENQLERVQGEKKVYASTYLPAKGRMEGWCLLQGGFLHLPLSD